MGFLKNIVRDVNQAAAVLAHQQLSPVISRGNIGVLGHETGSASPLIRNNKNTIESETAMKPERINPQSEIHLSNRTNLNTLHNEPQTESLLTVDTLDDKDTHKTHNEGDIQTELDEINNAEYPLTQNNEMTITGLQSGTHVEISENSLNEEDLTEASSIDIASENETGINTHSQKIEEIPAVNISNDREIKTQETLEISESMGTNNISKSFPGEAPDKNSKYSESDKEENSNSVTNKNITISEMNRNNKDSVKENRTSVPSTEEFVEQSFLNKPMPQHSSFTMHSTKAEPNDALVDITVIKDAPDTETDESIIRYSKISTDLQIQKSAEPAKNSPRVNAQVQTNNIKKNEQSNNHIKNIPMNTEMTEKLSPASTASVSDSRLHKINKQLENTAYQQSLQAGLRESLHTPEDNSLGTRNKDNNSKKQLPNKTENASSSLVVEKKRSNRTSDSTPGNERSNKADKKNTISVPNVHIGQIDITIEAPVQANTEVATTDSIFDFSSRNYLRRL